MIRNFPITSIFNGEYIYTKDIVNIIGKDYYKDVLDYGAREFPYKKFINHENYKTLDIKQNSSKTIDYVVNPGEKSNIPDCSFDLIILTDVIAHTDNADFVLKECYRLLKKGGKILLTAPFIYRENGTPYDYMRYTSYGLEVIIKKHGFKDFSQSKSGNFYYMIYTLINEKNIDNGEIVNNSFIFKYFFKLFNLTILPILNLTLFSLKVKANASTFRHLIITSSK